MKNHDKFRKLAPLRHIIRKSAFGVTLECVATSTNYTVFDRVKEVKCPVCQEVVKV